MGELIRKEVFRFTRIEKLTFVAVIISLAAALLDTIWAVYMDSFVNSVVIVGFLSASFTLISFLSYFIFIPLIEKTDKSKIYSYSILFLTFLYVLLALNTQLIFFIILAFILVILNTLKITSFGLIIKNKSPKKSLSKNEGFVYTFRNMAWVIGPLIAGYVASRYSIRMVFVLASIIIFIGFIGFQIIKIKDKNIKKTADGNIIKNFSAFFKNKDRVFAYIIGGGVNLWWVLIYLFIPLFMIRNGLSTLWIGYFLFAVALPLILFEYWFGKLAGKIGFKKIFKIGFLIPCLFALACFFMTNIYIILLLLVLASIGLSMLEPTTESYFFDILKGKQALRFYGPYNTTIGINRFIGKIVPSIFLIFLPFKFVFLIFAIFMFIIFLLCFKIKDVVEKNS